MNEDDFEKLADELDESISGSGSDSSESEVEEGALKDTTLTALLRKQAKIHEVGEEDDFSRKRLKQSPGKHPLFWFSSSTLPSNTTLGIYRALFTNEEQEAPSIEEALRKKQLRPAPAKPPINTASGISPTSSLLNPSIFMCMIGGGHFAAMIVSLTPKVSKHSTGFDQRQANVIAHKTFHRYTTRRKQGGGQSANDAAKGAAHSAGSSLRRYNEVALEQEIRALLTEWRYLIGNCQLIFLRATGSSNRRILLGPYDGQVLRHNDPRNRSFPFNTRRATQTELMRSFVELTRVKISQVDEAALAAAAAATQAEKAKEKAAAHSKAESISPKLSKEDQVALLHTTQIQALIRRSKVPALLQYLSTNDLSADFLFHPPNTASNHHSPTPLHLASSVASAPIVLALLTKASADPSLANTDDKVAFDYAGDRGTRDAFRIARHELGENRWDWATAKVPPALSRVAADERNARERAESEKVENERRIVEEERLKRQGPVVSDGARGGKTLGLKEVVAAKTAEEKMEEEGRGMTPEMRMRLERERRARAAEARMKR